MSEDKGNLENLRVEYSEANNNRRHYSSLRFAVLTVFFAVLGGVAYVAFGFVEIKSPSSLNIVRWARIAGFLFSVVFFWIEILCELNLRHFGRVAKALEESLGLRQFTSRKFRHVPKTPYATWGMYVLIILFWVYSILRA